MSDQPYDIVGLGACGVDLRATVPHLPRFDRKVMASHLTVSAGGVTANALVQCARLGLRTAWLGALGDDQWADWLTREFNDNGVAIPQPVIVPAFSSQQFWIATDPGGNSLLVGIPGASRQLTPPVVQRKFTTIIRRARHYHTEVAVIPLAAALAGAQIARRAKVKVLVDVDGNPFTLLREEKIGTRRELEALLRVTNIVKLSRPAALGLAQQPRLSTSTLRRILTMGPTAVAVTAGAAGCWIGDQRGIKKIPGIPIKVIDTVGAGDAFMGGLSFGLLRGWNLQRAAAFANACGAWKTAHRGTRAGGTFRQIQSLLSTRRLS